MEISLDNTDPPGTSLQDRVAAKILAMIRSGRLKAGSRLPGSRHLSARLGVSRNTVTSVYERLVAEGVLRCRGGAGTFVAQASDPERSSAAARLPLDLPPYGRSCGALRWDFQLETIDPEAFPGDAWRRLLIGRTRSSKFGVTCYGPPNGLPELRSAIAAHLDATRGIRVDIDQVLVVTGIQQALNVAARLFIKTGTSVVMEAPGCAAASALFRLHGANHCAVPVDTDGLMVEHLPQAIQAFAFVTPTRHFPLGMSMSDIRQRQLLAWARKTNSYVLEADFDSEFHYDGRPPPALQTLDSERVAYAGSFAMAIGPGLRIGYMIVPRALLAEAEAVLSLLDHGLPCHGVPWLDQAVLADFMNTGGFDAHLRRVRRLYMGRRDRLMTCLRDRLSGIGISGASSGTHLTCTLPHEFPSARDLQARVEGLGVGIYTLCDATIADAEYLDRWSQVLLLGFASQSEEAIEAGITRLASCVG